MAALTRENLRQAWKRVKANKGTAGVDGQPRIIHPWTNQRFAAKTPTVGALCANRARRNLSGDVQ